MPDLNYRFINKYTECLHNGNIILKKTDDDTRNKFKELGHNVRKYLLNNQESRFNNCKKYSKLKLKIENEYFKIVDVLFYEKDIPIKIKLYRDINFEEIINYLFKMKLSRLIQKKVRKTPYLMSVIFINIAYCNNIDLVNIEKLYTDHLRF